MDKKKTLRAFILLIAFLMAAVAVADIITPAGLQFCDRFYAYGEGNDTIKLYFNVTASNGKRISGLSPEKFNQMAYFYEDGNLIENGNIRRLSSGVRIPKEFTFSILLDKSIPVEGKRQILKSIRQFVGIAPDSCVFISFYGDEVSNSMSVSLNNFGTLEQEFLKPSSSKFFYSGVHSKLAEFSKSSPDFMTEIQASGYAANSLISTRAEANPGKNYLMVFAEGSQRPDDEQLDFITLTEYQSQNYKRLPKVYAFYYTADGADTNIDITLQGITHPKDSTRAEIKSLAGQVKSSVSMDEVLASFQTVIENATYDYELAYTATSDKTYSGNINYTATWGKAEIGEATFTIGSAERPWPERKQNTIGFILEFLIAILAAAVTFVFFFMIMKVLVPYLRSITFRSKYYKKYEPEENVQRRICHYCKQDLRPGQVIVTKCRHWMHKHCWEENGYKCAEYGQNCKTGIQNHVEWKDLFKLSSLKECSQTIAGILAGLVSWIIYELLGRGGFGSLSRFIVGLVFDDDDSRAFMIGDCVSRTSSFLMIGLLLGFFISVVFRYKDDIRNKNWKIWLKILLLSLMTGLVGMMAFAIGADFMCLMLAWSGKTYIPWYCSLPAYILFSVCVSLALTVRSTIPVRSALIGGGVSAVIGFLVLYFTSFASGRYEWLSMLLDFIIYGGGLGASLVTVRMLAEKYFLVIQNGVKSGQKIPIHKWMNATGGGNKVSIGMTGECEIQMNWEKGNKVAKEHARLYVDQEKNLPVIKPLATGVQYNSRAELPVNRPAVLTNGDTFRIGDTIFKYEEE
jgi:hypothetical protein